MRKKQVARFLDYSASLPARSVNQWTKEVQRWEKDDTKPNPFVDPSGEFSSMFVFDPLTVCFSNY
jgi:hypothetical protein